MKFVLGLLASIAIALLPLAGGEEKPVLKAGIIGLDTSHVPAFTGLLNNPMGGPEYAGIKVVAAYPGGSPDIPSSKNRLEGFTRQMRDKFQVEIVASIDELLKKVDVVLIESVDGRKHLEQVIPALKAGK
jgi:predicted dehydrogenase